MPVATHPAARTPPPALSVRTRPGRPSPALADRLAADVRALCQIDRPSASEGERRAAHAIRRAFAAAGAYDSRVEDGRAHGGYWTPLGAASALAAAAGIAGRSRRRLVRGAAAAVGTALAAAVYNDLDGAGHTARRMAGLQRRRTYNALGWFGDPTAERTVVLIAHHDAARSGLLFHPALPRAAARLPLPDSDATPPMMWPVFAAPLLSALGAATGSRLLASAGAVIGAGAGLVFADVARHGTVPGANDNLSAVAVLLELARRLGRRPPAGVRVLLLSCGAEESFMEGMASFARRHFGRLDRRRTAFVCLDTVGSQRLCLLDGEGMLRARRYDRALNETIAATAARLGVPLRGGVLLRNATDGLYPMRAGFPAASIGSYDPAINAPANYHWKTDTPDAVNYDTVAGCVRLCDGLLGELADRWPDAQPR